MPCPALISELSIGALAPKLDHMGTTRWGPKATRRPPGGAGTGSLSLAARVEHLSRYFDLDRILDRSSGPSDIRTYYRRSKLGYSLFHSRHGSIHMALNPDGAFDPDGYFRAPKLAWEALSQPLVPDRVLELGSGNGFNLDLIATRSPHSTFIGVDLVASHVRSARRQLADRPNATATRGDFQQLECEDSYFDAAFSIESFCHATDSRAALREVARVVRPGGSFAVIDAWRTSKRVRDPATRMAVQLTERSMSVANGTVQADWLADARAEDFRVSAVLPLSAEVMPNLQRFERLAGRFLAHPRLARLLGSRLGVRAIENVVAGYLMAESVRSGLHTYDMIVLARR